MPRPSLKDVRTTEILDAFMACVARHGIDGSTLERIAEVAGVGRPLLRHYLGNRDEMVDKLMNHVVTKFEHMTDDLVSWLPMTGRWDVLMDWLFDRRIHSSANAAVFQALIAASERYPDIRKPLTTFVHDFERTLVVELAAEFPDATEEQCRTVAGGVLSIYFNVYAMMPLSPGKDWIARQRQAADQLVASLPRESA